MTQFRAWPLVVTSLLLLPVASEAQVRASEAATVSQTVDGTILTVTYSRPRVRGREVVYGGLMPWGEVWTPGANYATTLETTSDITVNGHALPKGKYSVWMELQPKTWTVIFDPKFKAFHTEHPKPDSTQVRFPVTPADGKGPDVLTWTFPSISTTGTTLQMAWAGKSVTLDVAVPPSRPLTIPADLAPRYAGTYDFAWSASDPTEKADSTPPKPSTWNVRYEKGMLLCDWVGAPFPEWEHLVLIKIADNWFNPGSLVNGELWDVVSDIVIEFDVQGGHATGYEIRGENDEVIAKGALKK